MQIELSEERQAQLEAYAKRYGHDPSTALDVVLAEAFEWDQQDFLESLKAIQESYEDVRAGRTQPASEVFEELRVKYGFPR